VLQSRVYRDSLLSPLKSYIIMHSEIYLIQAKCCHRGSGCCTGVPVGKGKWKHTALRDMRITQENDIIGLPNKPCNWGHVWHGLKVPSFGVPFKLDLGVLVFVLDTTQTKVWCHARPSKTFPDSGGKPNSVA